MNFEVYSYWNLPELEGAFNAIASLTATNNFTGLLRLLALVAILSLALAVLAGRARQEDFWRWVVMLALVNGMMLVPKATVVLVDRTSSQPTRVVANVPIGLAALAHGTSKIGDWLTRAYETVFSLPNDLQFQKNGLMFGHRVLTETVKWTPELANGTWMRDFQEFWRECVMPDIASGYLSVDAINKSHDLWGQLNNTNPALYVTLTTVGTVSCPSAYTDLTNRLNSTVVPAMIQLIADMYYPGVATRVTQAKNAITAAFSYGLGVSNTAESIVKQQMTINASLTAYCNTFAQLGDANKAALCYSSTMGANQTNYTYQVLSKIAESSMPKLKSAIELIQYAVFPIIIAFAVVAGHLGLGVLKAYVMSLVWIQLWPPLYAIVHYIQTTKLPQYKDMLAGLGDTMVGQADLVQLGVSDQAIAGMLVLAIPPIAAALVKGGEVGLQAVAGLVSGPKTAERQAAENAKGNESLGQWKAAPMVDYAASPTPVMALRGADGSYTYTHPDGSVTYNAGTALDRASFRVSSAGREGMALNQSAEQAETAAVGRLVQAGRETSAAISQVGEFLRSYEKGKVAGNEFSQQDIASLSQAYNQMQDIAKNFEKLFGLREGMGGRVLGELAGSAGAEVFGTGLKTSLKAQGVSEATLSDEKKIAEALRLATQYQDALQRVGQVASQDKFANSDSSGARAMQGIRAHLDTALRHSEQASATYQQSLAYKELASKVKEFGVSIDQDLTTRIMNRLATERATIDGHTYNGFRKEEIDALMRQNSPEMRALIERIANEETAALIKERFGDLKTPEDVRRFFATGRSAVGDESAVRAWGQGQLDNVQGAARMAGVDPTQEVRSDLPGRVQKGLSKVEGEIAAGKSASGEEGAKVRTFVEGELEKPGSMLGRAFSNAGGAWMPQGTTFLLDKVGEKLGVDLTPGSFADREAKSYKGTIGEAIFDTAVFGLSIPLGGMAGRYVGNAVGRFVGKEAGEAAAAAIRKENEFTIVGQHFPHLTNIAAEQVKREVIEKAGEDFGRAVKYVGMAGGGVIGPAIFGNDGLLQRAWAQGEQAARGLVPEGMRSSTALQPEQAQPATTQTVSELQSQLQEMRQKVEELQRMIEEYRQGGGAIPSDRLSKVLGGGPMGQPGQATVGEVREPETTADAPPPSTIR